MKIGRIETFFVPPRWLFVRVETDDGAIGWGEASLEGHAEAVAGAFEPLRDRFIGHDAFAIEDDEFHRGSVIAATGPPPGSSARATRPAGPAGCHAVPVPAR